MDQSPTPPHADPSEQSQPAAQEQQPATQVGMVSPDGLWRWDGTTWVPTSPSSPAVTAARAPVKDPRPIARWAVIGLLATAVAEVIAIVADAGRIDVVNRILNGSDVSQSDASNSDNFVRLSAVLEIAVFVVTAVLFLSWIHRIVANNHALGLRRLRFTPGWAVGWWFIPFLNLVRPFQVVAESWRATAPEVAEAQSYEPPSGPVPALVAAWWGAFLLGNVLARIAVAVQSGEGLQQLHDSAFIDIISSAVTIVAALLGALVVRQLTERQAALVSSLREKAAAA